MVYACAHGTLSLPWTLSVTNGDVIEDIQWFYSGRSQELIATEAHGFFFLTPAFSGRAQQITNAGIEIDHVPVEGWGNYSVEVIARTAGGDVVTLRRSATVHVTGWKLVFFSQQIREVDHM